MNKLVFSLLTLLIAGSCYAKTAIELQTETDALGVQNFAARRTYAEANKADIIAMFNKWVELTQFNTIYDYNVFNAHKDVTDEIKATKRIAVMAYWLFPEEINTNVSDVILAGLSVECFIVNNPEKYSEIKNNGWKIDNIQLSNYAIAVIAIRKGDLDVLSNNDIISAMNKSQLESSVSALKTMMLNATDVTTAKTICVAIEKQMLLKNCASDKVDTIKTVNKYLTERIIEQKLTK